ncbi:MAG: tctC [Ramlibacter sp.]|uniref:tripartite tricarboxylate transporter substrate-binding protein n=1 Tax=Ramlibacter sp. TaxID=1917967 RepID=UPI002601777C|nr:tripartite tricarboxylate transporter substrate-binding protein [Ramlibacter sp.]MDB5750042.1 tctC [Ramlibacter sp.]
MLTIPIERKTAFHWQDFDLLGKLVDDPGNFSVHADSPHKTLKDLVAFAKANPGAVTYGTTGIGSDDHISALMLAGIKMTHVPFKGAAEVHNGIVGKQITVAAMNIGEALQYAKGGSAVRQLGQMSTGRSTLAPGVPPSRNRATTSSWRRCAASPRPKACRRRCANNSPPPSRRPRPTPSSRPRRPVSSRRCATCRRPPMPRS